VLFVLALDLSYFRILFFRFVSVSADLFFLLPFWSPAKDSRSARVFGDRIRFPLEVFRSACPRAQVFAHALRFSLSPLRAPGLMFFVSISSVQVRSRSGRWVPPNPAPYRTPRAGARTPDQFSSPRAKRARSAGVEKGFSARVPTKLFHQQTSALEFFPAHAGFVFQCRLSRSDFLGRCSHLVSVSRDSFPHMIPVFGVVSRSWILRLGVSWHR
jgi:hypothetical protein